MQQECSCGDSCPTCDNCDSAQCECNCDLDTENENEETNEDDNDDDLGW